MKAPMALVGPLAMTDHRVVGTKELKWVRHQLDALNLQRLEGRLSVEDENLYRTLCREERALLETMTTVALADHESLLLP